MEKRGLSGIVLTIIMIGLVLVAVGIVWGVISNILTSQSEDVETSFQALNLDLKIERALVEDGVISVTVKRGAGGGGEVNKLNLILSDGVDSEAVIVDVSLKELEKKTFNISFDELSTVNLLNVKEVSVGDVSNTGKVGSVRDSFVEIKDRDLIAYYDFEGNANDKSGNGNNGAVTGAVLSDGKVGQAYDFDGDGDYINISYSDNFDVSDENEVSVSFWVYPRGVSEGGTDIFGWTMGCWELNYYRLYYSERSGDFRFSLGGEETDVCSNTAEGYYKNDRVIFSGIEKDKWYFVTGTASKDELCIYVNEDKVCADRNLPKVPNIASSHRNLMVGSMYPHRYFFDGKVDEVKIWSRALSEEEVNALYEI